jgi:decaprenylphospho-beta-D-ribofuranose 2-oxidase
VALANRARLTGARWRPERLSPLGAVLHPLDAAYGLPGLYGRRGLVQYQFVVPFGAEDVVTAVLTLPQAAGCPATLAVLKVFGDQGVAPLSFPMAGWSLAMDFPAAAAPIARVLDELDDRVAAAGGRVYLVKDSRLRPELLDAMYPRLRRWRQIRAAMDPQRLMVSDLARRLGLTSPNGRRDA